MILERFPDALITREIVPDETGPILEALERHLDSDFIITTGGTGIGPRDLTPDATESFCDRALPGIAETLRAQSYRETSNAMLSRAFAGVKGRTIVINFPGSQKAVKLCTRTILPVMEHAPRMLRGEGH